jgi:Asp-tRNA(Asn)/Glu-tRNA(Gln) amidotransferase A subunit family amidase
MALTELAVLRDASSQRYGSLKEMVSAFLERANSNASRNVYLWQDSTRILGEADLLPSRFPNPAERPPLFGLPVSLKDCFDMAGTATTCGTRFYAEKNGPAVKDSWVAAKLRRAGAVIVGKTHLHPLAYGITGENPDFGDCVQPRNSAWLTGGSSSGAAASVQEGSAVAAIGTDTGGSIRVPAALCGLAGYRSSLGMGSWQGGAHLAQSFDTFGWLYRDLEDGPLLAHALFDLPNVGWVPRHLRIGVVSRSFLHDCEDPVLTSMADFEKELRYSGAELVEVDVSWWEDLREIFVGIQAHEAAHLHTGNFDAFEASIRDRLSWGASLSKETVEHLRQKHANFLVRMEALLDEYDFFMMPAAPVSVLAAGADHSTTRQRLLRYTAGASLAGVPVVTVPMREGGMQLLSGRNRDQDLLAFSSFLGRQRQKGSR